MSVVDGAPPRAVVGAPEVAVGAAHEASVQRRNFWLHVLEGSALNGAFGAINGNTVGTSLVEHLGGSAWMVALMPMASTMGFALGPILIAHHVDRQRVFMPLLRRTVPASRLPILVTALVLWLCGASAISLWTVGVGALLHGVLGGLSVGAWQQLVARTVPATKRPSMFSLRYLIANVLGLFAGSLVTGVLARWPGTDGYALLHLVAFVGAVISYRLLASVREPSEPSEQPEPGRPTPPAARGPWQNLRQVPSELAADRRLVAYLASIVLGNSHYLLMGFFALWAKTVLGANDAYVGTLTSAQMSGAVSGTLLAACLGDRQGGRRLLIAARLVLVLVAAGAAFADGDWEFRGLFALYGAAIWVSLAGHNTMTLELVPASRRSTLLAVFSLAQVPSMLLVAELGARLWHAGVSFAWIAGLSAFGSLLALLALSAVRERRA